MKTAELKTMEDFKLRTKIAHRIKAEIEAGNIKDVFYGDGITPSAEDPRLKAAEGLAEHVQNIKNLINPCVAHRSEFSKERQIQVECEKALKAWNEANK